MQEEVAPLAPGQAGAPAPAVLTRRSSLRITIASLLGALSGYVVLAIVARSVSLSENATFVTFWSALFTMYGVLTGMGTETARSVAQAGLEPGRPGRATVAVALRVGAGVVGLVGLLLAATGLHVFGPEHRVLAFVVALSAAAYAVEAVLLGALSGRGRWDAYAGMLGLEAVLRVVLVGAVAWAAATVTNVAVASGAAALVWIVMLLLSRDVRQAVGAELDAPLRGYLGRVSFAATASGASAVLLVGFPVLVSLTTERAVYDLAAPLMLAISLTRAPIMVPLTSFQSVIVAQFVKNRAGAGRTVLRAVAALVALGIVGGAAAYAVGPWLMATLFGPDYRVAGWILAGMTLASVGTAIITITAALTQALRRQVSFVAGWLVALAVSVAILLTGLPIEQRVVGALLVAPYVGVVVHAVAVVRELRRPVAAAA